MEEGEITSKEDGEKFKLTRITVYLPKKKTTITITVLLNSDKTKIRGMRIDLKKKGIDTPCKIIFADNGKGQIIKRTEQGSPEDIENMWSTLREVKDRLEQDLEGNEGETN